ncbi:MAG: hypothetical protein M9944_16985 [Rhizobiaceae bacterium]|nr:hypothetical protein [Rhizobiaceae bacterium]
MPGIDVFVPPSPKRWMIATTSVINRVAMLRGVPRLRDLWPFSLIPGIRGISDVRVIDLPEKDLLRLKSVCGQGKATFIAPSHPEFFTDWMIDKELLWRAAPMAASWATHGVVNGMGGLMQRFWLANNLIAQIPGNTDAARRYSVEWAAKGHGVLLHPEGAVGWHNDYVARLLPGAVEMAAAALQLGAASQADFRAFVVPVVWKLVFLKDAEPGLQKEAGYVERSLGLASGNGKSSAERVFDIYDALILREFRKYDLTTSRTASLRHRQAALIEILSQMLAEALGPTSPRESGVQDLLRAARRWLRESRSPEKTHRAEVKELADDLARLLRLGSFAFESKDITQEQVAEHLKRLRNDYCVGSLRDSINRFLPRPVAPRRAIIRVAEPIEITKSRPNTDEALIELRNRLQFELDAINEDLRREGAFRTQVNLFHRPD